MCCQPSGGGSAKCGVRGLPLERRWGQLTAHPPPLHAADITHIVTIPGEKPVGVGGGKKNDEAVL